MESTGTNWLTVRKEIIGNALSIGVAVAMYGVSFGALGTTLDSQFHKLWRCPF